jgi:Fe-S cluster assembly iron-binding protein IscA
MLSVTAPAKELLRSIEVPPDRALRLEPENDGRLAFTATTPEVDDQVVEEQGREILRIAEPIARELDGHSLDRVETPEGPRLTIRSPETAGANGA